ncbi:MAG: 3-oxoacyl-[acyl-carrier-protein] reductase [Acholeplasmataceae bacterium]|jgi:3-oxoacyl-[acyl-carrier protein] reductase|nr:3-oxoacyl-[acyl-carrier-protein] reductase [Acholeplasmataceae bacterium]
MNLSDKVAIVTGGANGIGREIVHILAAQGAKVIINYRSSEDAAKNLQAELADNQCQVDIFRADVASFSEAEKLVEYVVEKYGRVDILVNNAGITADNLIMRMNEDDFDRVIDVNLKGTWNCSKHAAKYMVKQRSGKIINISSVVGLIGNAGQSNYAASKAGIIGLTKSLARELAKRNINVNAVAPGFIQTQMTANLSEELVKGITENIPLGRLGEPRDVANLVAFLCSEEANYLTGQVINVDGGMVMN